MFIIFFSVVTVFFYIMIHNKLQCLLQMHTGVRQKVLFRLNCFKMLDRWFPLEHTFTLADSFTFYERQCNFLTEFIARSEYLLRHRLPLLRRFVLCKTPPCMFHTHTPQDAVLLTIMMYRLANLRPLHGDLGRKENLSSLGFKGFICLATTYRVLQARTSVFSKLKN